MKKVSLLRVVLASPGDVKAEREAAARVVEEINHGLAAARPLRLELFRWETDTYPGFHPDGPQGLIDPIGRIEDCDILIGIFWKRFGTPAYDSQSGTEHEILTAYDAWKSKRRPHIMIYFNQKPYTPQSTDELEQWRQVLEFRQRFPREGLWWPYNGKAEFERLVRRHFTLLIPAYGDGEAPPLSPEKAESRPQSSAAARPARKRGGRSQGKRKPAGGADSSSVIVGGTRNITIIGEASGNTFITGDKIGRKK